MIDKIKINCTVNGADFITAELNVLGLFYINIMDGRKSSAVELDATKAKILGEWLIKFSEGKE